VDKDRGDRWPDAADVSMRHAVAEVQSAGMCEEGGQESAA
jgi:hypothetical protein